MNIEKPKGWRKGQMLFNFLEWLSTNGGTINQCGPRCADTFYNDDEFIDEKWAEYLKVLNQEEIK